jgi:hypothetical protein
VFWEHLLTGRFGLGSDIISTPSLTGGDIIPTALPTTGYLYVWGERDILRAFSYSRATGFSLLPLASSHVKPADSTLPCPAVACLGANTDRGQHDPDVPFTARNSSADSSTQGPDGMAGGMLSLSAHGADPSTGIVWAATNQRLCASGDMRCDSEHYFTPGVLTAFQAVPIKRGRDDNSGGQPNGGLQQLWTNGGMDAYFFAKFVPPTVYGGKVYLAGNTIPHVSECEDATQPCAPPGGNAWAMDASEVQGHVYVYGLSCLPSQVPSSKGVCEFKADIVTILGATLFIPPLDVIPKTGAQLSVEATSNNPAALLFLTVRGCPTVQDAPMTRNGSNYDFFSTVGRADCAFSISSLGAMAMVRSSLGGTASKRIDVRDARR